jgi:predicted kinase
MTPTLIMPVGLPRSGKSTWARSTGFPMVNPDSIRLSLHGQAFYTPAEAFVWATAHLMVQSLFTAGHQTVILDATNLTERRRAEWRSKDWHCAYVLFPTPEDECIRRALANCQEELIPVIHRMAKDMTFPVDSTVSKEWAVSPTFLDYRPNL